MSGIIESASNGIAALGKNYISSRKKYDQLSQQLKLVEMQSKQVFKEAKQQTLEAK